MSNRSSGANNFPLGRQSFGNGQKSSLLKPSYMTDSSSMVGKRELEDSNPPMRWSEDLWSNNSDSNQSQGDASGGRKRKRKSRWGGDEKEKVFIPGLPTVLPNNLDPQQERAYLLQLQIEEISRRLRTGDLGIPANPEERSPSPEPIYNTEGKRLNTREYRTRKKLEDDRHTYITEMYTVNPEYKPPADYKPPLIKVSEKVMIPQEEHPDINFVGLLIGPRGNTLKSMEKETGAKIIIRGKGSVKEGKVGRKDGHPLPGEDEPLHAFVTGNSNESVKKAVNKIREIIRQGVEVPEGQNDLRRMQLRELALLNGTLRESDGPRCMNCGASDHRSWQCPDKPNVTNNVICTNCGAAGHIAKDCREAKSLTGGMCHPDKSKIDEEYMSLMAELGEGPPPPAKAYTGMQSSHASMGPLLANPTGVPRAIMAPPGSSNAQYQSPTSQSMYKSSFARPPPPSPNYGAPPPVMAPPGQMGMSPWGQAPPFSQQSPQQGGLLPPPPPPSMAGGAQPATTSAWMAPNAQGAQWPMPPGPMPVPPPPGMGPMPPTMYPFMGGPFMGVPPPMPGMPGMPPATQDAAGSALTVTQLLAAPPPPPPPPPS